MVNITALHDLLLDEDYYSNFSSLSLVGFYGSGIRSVVERSNLKNTLIYVDSRKLVSEPESFIRLIAGRILNSDRDFLNSSSSVVLRDDIQSHIMTSKSQEYYILLNHAENLSLLEKEALNEIAEIVSLKVPNDDAYFKSIFVFENPIEIETLFREYLNLSKVIASKILYIKGFRVAEIGNVLESAIKDSGKISRHIYDLTSGVPLLVNILLDHISNLLQDNQVVDIDSLSPHKLIEEEIIKNTLLEVVSSIDEEKLEYLFKKEPNYIRKYFIKVGILDDKGDLPRDSLLRKMLSGKDHNYLNLKSSLSTDDLSPQEFEVFKFFQKNEGEIVEKVKVAEIIGVKKKDPKRRDWAVDQLIKRLRDKLGDNKGQLIKTIRGRGYKFDSK